MLFIPRKLKSLKSIAILFSFQLLFASGIFSQENLDSIYKANKIVRIEHKTVMPQKTGIVSEILNKDGLVKIYRSGFIYNKKWHNLLIKKNNYEVKQLIKTEMFEYEDDTLFAYTTTIYSTQKKGNQEIISSSDSRGYKTKEIRITNKHNLIDSILEYSNDSIVNLNNEDSILGQKVVRGKNLRFERITINKWDQNKQLKQSLHCLIYLYNGRQDSSLCRTYNYIKKGDTTFTAIDTKMNDGEIITEYQSTINTAENEETFLKDGYKSTTQNFKNKLGLVIEEISSQEDKQRGNSERITTTKYFTRKGELSLN
jgi:hypothetical protein